jgi:Cu2+-exporting ATPase
MGAARASPTNPVTASGVLHVGCQYRAGEKAVVESALARQPGVVSVEANPVAQTATVRYDPAVTSVQALRRAVERCGSECAGCNVPGCVCDPLHEPGQPEHSHDGSAVNRAHDPSGQGEGGHAGHSMDHMASEMRNRSCSRSCSRWRSSPSRA